MTESHYTLTLSCPDARGIVAAVSGFITDADGFIVDSAQFGDASTGQFFLRMEFQPGPKTLAEDELKKAFYSKVAERFKMNWNLYNRTRKTRVLVMVSKHGHCLNDILHRHHTGLLPIEIPAVISNHPDMKSYVEWHNIPYYHFPMDGDKPAQEAKVWDAIVRHNIDFVVLARYMQILSPELCGKLQGRAINIHHSFLPSFKGAKPYHQAFDRGVKLIGATAHFVTPDLDEGPIIDQEVARVDHTFSPEDLEATGRDAECVVLARALKHTIEHRVLINGHKTVVFR
jgi:formyltetrahydrofolate deformylase